MRSHRNRYRKCYLKLCTAPYRRGKIGHTNCVHTCSITVLNKKHHHIVLSKNVSINFRLEILQQAWSTNKNYLPHLSKMVVHTTSLEGFIHFGQTSSILPIIFTRTNADIEMMKAIRISHYDHSI